MGTGPAEIPSLQALPRLREGSTTLCLDHARIERADAGVVAIDGAGRTSVPVAQLSALLLGPGTSITHDAVAALAASGCAVAWVGGGCVRHYAVGLGETRSAANLLRQVAAYANTGQRERVVRELYAKRFGDPPTPGPIAALRGREGVRVREAYRAMARRHGIEWRGRVNDGDWNNLDAPNRALSSATACLHALATTAIVTLGFSPAIGFIHTGHVLAFAHDLADVYKLRTALPIAFREAAKGDADLERRVRLAMRRLFVGEAILERMAADLFDLFGGDEVSPAVAGLLGEDGEVLPGRRNYGGAR